MCRARAWRLCDHDAGGHGWVALLNDLGPESLLFQICRGLLDALALDMGTRAVPGFIHVARDINTAATQRNQAARRLPAAARTNGVPSGAADNGWLSIGWVEHGGVLLDARGVQLLCGDRVGPRTNRG